VLHLLHDPQALHPGDQPGLGPFFTYGSAPSDGSAHWTPSHMDSLPFLTCLVAATILARQNKTLISEVTYLRAEIAYLRDQLPAGTTFHFTDRWRKRLARAAAGVGWKRLADLATVAKASTIRR